MPNTTWRVTGTAVQGISHQKNGTPCQDAVGFRVLTGETILAALADGAGTAAFSDRGAQRVVAAVLDSLETGLGDVNADDGTARQELVRTAFQSAQAALQDLSIEAGEPLREFATTLTCAVITQDWLAAGQIGDGAVIIRDVDGVLRAATQIQRGEYANETHFLSQEDALEQVEITVCSPGVDALALLSDGLIRLAMKLPSYEPHTPFFQPLFDFTTRIKSGEDGQQQSVEQLAAFLTSERVCARTDDDKSLVLAVRVNGASLNEDQLEEEH